MAAESPLETKNRLRTLRDGRLYDRVKEVAELPLLLAALALIPILAAPYMFELGSGTEAALDAAAWFIWALFAVEYLLLFTVAPDRLKMFKTHIFDLLIIVLPFLRPLRAARSLRLLRLLAISGRIGSGFRTVSGRKGNQMFGGVVVLVVLVGALLAYAFEKGAADSNIQSFPDAIWWAIVTATTVGYGDLSPVTTEGRAIAVVLMLVGIGLLGVITANVAAFFVHNDDNEQTRELNNKLARMEDLLAELSSELKRGNDSHMVINPEMLEQSRTVPHTQPSAVPTPV